jgi:hypothetical protein
MSYKLARSGSWCPVTMQNLSVLRVWRISRFLPVKKQWFMMSSSTCKKYDILHTRGTDIFYLITDHQWPVLTRYSSFWGDPSCLLRVWSLIVLIRVITKLPNSEQSYKGKVKSSIGCQKWSFIAWYKAKCISSSCMDNITLLTCKRHLWSPHNEL